MSYLNRFLEFPVLSTISATSLPEFKRTNDVVVVGYIAAEDKDSTGQFELLAKTMHPEYLFGITNDSALAKSERIDMPGVAVYKISNGEKNTLALVDDMDKMVINLKKTARPLIVDLAFELHEGLLDVSRQQTKSRVTHKLSLIACSLDEYSFWVRLCRYVSRTSTTTQGNRTISTRVSARDSIWYCRPD